MAVHRWVDDAFGRLLSRVAQAAATFIANRMAPDSSVRFVQMMPVRTVRRRIVKVPKCGMYLDTGRASMRPNREIYPGAARRRMRKAAMDARRRQGGK